MVKNWWKLIRGWNVLFVMAIVLILHFGFLGLYRGYVSSIALERGYTTTYLLGLSNFEAVLLALAAGFIAIAGYIINDVYDQQADMINKPERRTINVTISEKVALRVFTACAALGLGLAAFVGYRIDHINFTYIHAVSLAILWLYAMDFKGRVLIGNALIALLAALNVWTIALYDLLPSLILLQEGENNPSVMGHPTYQHFILITVLAGFAFISTLLREIVKDVEDVEGDRKMGYNTVGTYFSTNAVKWVIFVVVLLELAGLAWVMSMWRGDLIALIYIGTLLVLPLIAFTAYLPKMQTKEQFGKVSKLLKIHMLVGLFTPVVLLSLTLLLN